MIFVGDYCGFHHQYINARNNPKGKPRKENQETQDEVKQNRKNKRILQTKSYLDIL
jgi:hypothetical protein